MNFIKPNGWTEPSRDEVEIVSELLGKTPQGEFQIVLRDDQGHPLVIENSPFFHDGTPMPTHYWLLPSPLYTKVSMLESAGGVKKVQEEITLDAIALVHDAYRDNRNKLISDNYEGPRPSGGVGGTRKGVKCLHAHVANLLATKDDIVGQWTLDEITKIEQETE